MQSTLLDNRLGLLFGLGLLALADAAPELLKDAALGPQTLAKDGDWDDIRALDVDRLRRLSQRPAP